MERTDIAKPILVMVVAANPTYLRLIQDTFSGSDRNLFEPTYVDQLSKALALLRTQNPLHRPVDIILLDLSLPDCQGLDTFLQVRSQAAEVPVVILAPGQDRETALQVIREGAQDCLLQAEVNENDLSRALLFALERHRTWLMLQQLCLTDDLTGLLNRRGFMSIAQQQIKVARRENWKLLLLFADLDGLKKINDNHGHPQGDYALQAVAGILRETFRTSDLVARLGGDEFIVLATNVSPGGVETITRRLHENIDRFNQTACCFQISLSWGVVLFDPGSQPSLEEVIIRADQDLYRHKLKKR